MRIERVLREREQSLDDESCGDQIHSLEGISEHEGEREKRERREREVRVRSEESGPLKTSW